MNINSDSSSSSNDLIPKCQQELLFLSISSICPTSEDPSITSATMHFIPLVAVSLAATITSVTAYPIKDNGVHCRTGPGTEYSIVKSYDKGHEISIVCQAPGMDIFGDKLWDKTSDGCYVSDYYVKTGSSSYVTKECGSSSGGGGGGSGSGASIVKEAEKEKGLPYVWGGGGCHGPSGGGFDCSGLTQFAVCQALGKEIPRTAQTQYDSHLGRRYPRSEAKEGDLLFWAENGDCANRVSHVGIFIRDGWMINAAHTGTPVREQAIWTSYGGESICPEVMRYGITPAPFPFPAPENMRLTFVEQILVEDVIPHGLRLPLGYTIPPLTKPNNLP